MKDLTHYLIDAVKSSESIVETASEVIDALTNTTEDTDIETTNDTSKTINNNNNDNDNNSNKKRGRVKIKICKSQRGKVCKIITSNDDLIDKTPSPLPASSRVTRVFDDESNTPKRMNIINENTNNNYENTNGKMTIPSNLDSSNECIFSPVKREKCVPANQDSKVMLKREESNAFQMLMTRDKSIKANSKPLSLVEVTDDDMKMVEENKDKLKRNHEKLIALADKKGKYTKRKLTEAEEDERMEKQLASRAKIFKQKSCDSMQAASKRAVTPRGLHRYFSAEDKDKMTVMKNGDVDNSVGVLAINGDDTKLNKVVKEIKPNGEVHKFAKKESKRARKVLETIVDDQLLTTNLSVSNNEAEGTLMINLPSTESESGTTDDDNSDFQLKSSSQTASKSSTSNRLICKKNKIMEKKRSNSSSEKGEIIEIAEVTVTKSEIVPQNNLSDSSDSIANNSDIEVIETKILKRPPNEKLAPLFVKRPKPNPEVLAARREFLLSRSPESKKRRDVKKSTVPPRANGLPFPSISHVMQSTDENHQELGQLNHPLKVLEPYIPVLDISQFKSVTTLHHPGPSVSNGLNVAAKPDPEEVLKEIEERCIDAREMWARISRLVTQQSNRLSPKRRGRKRKSTEKKPPLPSIGASEAQRDVWIQKYRPMSAKEIVGNKEAAEKLRCWLSAWRVSANKEDYSSSEEFYTSDNSRSSTLESSQPVAILLGPHGSGKTASVYAIAEELGYNVLEVNASSKRPGRKILKDLEEATKSHRVKKIDNSLKTAFALNSGQNDGSNDSNKKVAKNSLILFEDVDVIFDEDDGLISAIYQLASSTKRPIVMTCRDTCTHLNRMAPHQLKIHFQPIKSPRAFALLDLIALAEAGTRLPRSCLDKLLMTGDLRKALLQLQYLLISESPCASLLPNDFRETLWQDMRHYLYKPTLKLNKKRTKKDKTPKSTDADSQSAIESNVKLPTNTSTNQNSNILHKLAKDLDTISIVSSLVDIDDHILNISDLKCEPSLSLEENIHYYSSNDVRSSEISEWLRHHTFKNNSYDNDNIDMKMLKQLLLKKELNAGIDLALSQVSMHTLDSRAMSIDYLPATRTICRAEELKSSNNIKRGNRFFHYLHGLRISTGILKPNILAAACKAMQDKP